MTFFIGAALLTLVAIAFIVSPWLHQSKTAHDVVIDRRQATVDIVRARLAELDAEHRDGVIDETTYQSLKVEQERRLLDDVRGLEAGKRQSVAHAFTHARWILLAAALVTPIVAVLTYRHFGNWLDWSIQQTLQQSQQLAGQGKDNRAALIELARLLEKRLQQRNDDDGRRRFLLARLNIELGRTDAALTQFRALVIQFPQDADLLAQLAQTQYLAADRKLTPDIAETAQRALALNPDQSTALGLLGIAAFERKDYAQALMHWRRLLRQLQPGSQNAQMIERGIAQAEANLGPEGLPGPKFDVSVSVDPKLAGQVRGTLFVFAKAVNGPPLPLAVARFDNPTLPLSVTLDDTMAMAPGMNLSSAKQVQIFARVTASGQVRGEAGDLEGSSPALDINNKSQQLSLVIDRQL